MALFNSNLTTSISGWFSNTFQPKQEDEAEKNEAKKSESTEETNEEQNETSPIVKPEASSSQDTEPEKVEERDESDEMSKSVLDLNADEVQKKLTEETQKMVSSAKIFGSYLFGVATEATKKVSSTVNETASNLKKTMEEQTILGDLNREQKEFIEKKREKEGHGAVPPWYGYTEEETMKQQILVLSTDSRNFLRSPPSGVQFNFDFGQMFPVALATLKEDENLKKMRFKLVPTKIKEEQFWHNYFYRVSLIKQSAQLTTLSEMNKVGSDNGSTSSTSSIVMVGSTAIGTALSRSNSAKSLTKNEPESKATKTTEINTELDQEDIPAEFASDAFDPSTLNPDDLEREMRELGMDGNEEPGGEIPEWEQELQKELKEYEVVAEQGKDDLWEKEIDDMLTTEDAC